MTSRRRWLKAAIGGLIAAQARTGRAEDAAPKASRLEIRDMIVTPIALPDPPLLAASGCHGPYFLRNIVEIRTEGGIVGFGETYGGIGMTKALAESRSAVIGKDAFAYRSFENRLASRDPACYAGVEMACLDACGRATGLRVCDLLGGSVREEVELAAYLFYRYAADDPRILDDPRIADDRGKGAGSLDRRGEVRSAEAMAKLAKEFEREFGFRSFKLKGGVIDPREELESMKLMHQSLAPGAKLRIDPNARWKLETALSIGAELKSLPLEYYEDPVAGIEGMAEVRAKTGLPMSTNMCVTRFSHIPEALRLKPIDVLLADHHYWGGFHACLAVDRIAGFANWTLSQHSNSHSGLTMAAMIHLAAVLPRLTAPSDTHYPWLPERFDIIEKADRPVIRSGTAEVPLAPGWGVRIDRDRLAQAHERYTKSGMTGRDDGALMRKLVPGWRGELL